MASYSETDDQSFVTCDEISSVSDLITDCSEAFVSSRLANCALGYEFWTKEPCSVDERRARFLKWMGLGSDWDNIVEYEEINLYHEDTTTYTDNLKDDMETGPYSNFPSFRSCENPYLLENGPSDENLNLQSGPEYVADGVGRDQMISLNVFRKTLGSSSLVQQLLGKDFKGFKVPDFKNKTNWFQRFSHIMDRTKGFLCNPNFDQTTETTQSVHVNVSKKKSKELSSLQAGQEFPAHNGSILTMKFSPDGLYLASAGVDGVVRVWKVLEDDVANKFDARDIDPSCLYFSLNDFSKLSTLDYMNSMKKSSGLDSPCVHPLKVFQLSEKPLHEYHGHEGEVLALSWCKNGHLLSSSVDKTTRLWRMGHDHCQGVYLHNNYVTCVEFNPVDDNRFISGSIDGKIRIWEIEGGRVIDWIDIRDIVTAVCYSPDGKGGVVGSMGGNCRFYDIIDNRLELGASISLKGKKKLPGNRITGFQYCPSDASKLMVTSADSRVRILSGTNIICKFKGNRNSASQVPASFTADGEHVVTATEDSNVRVWNYTTDDQKSSRKKNVRSHESFFSRNASIAIPWCGLKNKLGALPGSILRNGHFDQKLLQKFPDRFAARLGFLLDALYKVSATWPEEKLAKSNLIPVIKPLASKSEFKFLKNAWMSAFNNAPHLWGLVIVTAGWDGCIRTFLNYGLPLRF
ncbi:hypothetical protein CASFOL_037092 [Castilleja foliolosa]|uniref:Uncharacterized protein n=1 Tax=Castilleja foliolosa TaxID=1961234 RepID=A0ABD3BQH3_9LAMI